MFHVKLSTLHPHFARSPGVSRETPGRSEQRALGREADTPGVGPDSAPAARSSVKWDLALGRGGTQPEGAKAAWLATGPAAPPSAAR